MNKIYKAVIIFFISSFSQHLHAQLFSVGSGGSLSIKSGTILSADQLQIVPSIDYSISNNNLILATSASNISGIASINRVYKFSNTLNTFKGEFQLFYQDNELNGLTESGMNFLYNTGALWVVDLGSTINTSSNVMQSSAFNGVSIKELTAGKLLVVPLLSVTPLTQTICSGTSITPIVFNDINNEAGTTYSWTRDNTTLIKGISASSGSGQMISGVFINNSTTVQSTTFTMKATNSKGTSTKWVTLTVNPTVAISKQPSAVSVNNGKNTFFEVGATGLGISYQWQLSVNGGGSWINVLNNTMYSGATSTKLMITSVTSLMNGYLYRCVVSSSICGGPLTSAAAKLSVKGASTLSTLNNIKPDLEISSSFNIHAHPNPSPNTFRVYVTTSENEWVDLVLSDLSGKIIKTVKVRPNEFVDLGMELPAATYILVARQGMKSASMRIVKL